MTTTAAARRAATRWTLDCARSTATFRVRTYWGAHTVEGRFDRIEGSYVRGGADPRIELTIDADSLDTGNRLRDLHLRGERFFRVESHPQVRFESTSVVERGDGKLDVTGCLEAGGRKLPLTLAATIAKHGEELEIETTTTIDQRELGMIYSPFAMIRSPATLHVVARLCPER